MGNPDIRMQKSNAITGTPFGAKGQGDNFGVMPMSGFKRGDHTDMNKNTHKKGLSEGKRRGGPPPANYAGGKLPWQSQIDHGPHFQNNDGGYAK